MTTEPVEIENGKKMFLRRFCCRSRTKHILIFFLVLFILDYFGAFTHFFEKDFYSDFDYPLNDENIPIYARQLRDKQMPDLPPFNFYNYTFITNTRHTCRHVKDNIWITPRLVFLIKSAIPHIDRRNAIRQSWGFEQRFSDVIIRTVFLLGIPSQNQLAVQKAIDDEHRTYGDIVQANFIDTYFNNTIKTIIGLKWAATECPHSKFYMFVDDDFYVSTKNVLRFVRNPIHYPEYLEEADEALRKLARRLSQSDLLTNETIVNVNLKKEMQDLVDKHSIHTINNKEHLDQIKKYLAKGQLQNNELVPNQKSDLSDQLNNNKNSRQLLDLELADDVRLFSGFVFSSAPHRHRSSKWYVSLKEYPWHMWPPYVTAGAFVLSREALQDMYYVSMYTKHFR